MHYNFSLMGRLDNLTRRQKTLAQAAFDYCLSFIITSATLIKFYHVNPTDFLAFLIPISIFAGVVTIAVGFCLEIYNNVVRYISFQIFPKAIAVTFATTFATSSLLFFLNYPLNIAFCIFFFLSLSGLLIAGRVLIVFVHRLKPNSVCESVAIYGAGDAGRQLLHTIDGNRKLKTKFFIDDDVKLQGLVLNGVKIHSYEKATLEIKNKNVNKVLVAMPSVPSRRRGEIIAKLKNSHVEVLTVPSLRELISGRVHFEDFRSTRITALLGREPVEPERKLLQTNIFKKTVVVTGAGGSIGSELCKQIVQLQPKRLLAIDVSEIAIYNLINELDTTTNANSGNKSLLTFIASVQDEQAMMEIFTTFEVDTIYHAAAYKHVPIMEQNVFEAFKNNYLGTETLLKVASEYYVKNFILISTDKAVRPTNFMGASKRAAELACQLTKKKLLSEVQKPGLSVSIVRFGNVLGSSGSVIPLFTRQIESGGPVTVTHPEVTRYFMTIQEAVELVIQAGAMGNLGEVYVLDMGEPMKIVELAKQLIALKGFEPTLSANTANSSSLYIPIVFTGLRPGEKLFEELLASDQSYQTKHEKIFMERENDHTVEEISLVLQNIQEALTRRDHNKLVRAIYHPLINYDLKH